MAWQSEITDRLNAAPCCGYRSDDPPATEPTALAAMALVTAGQLTGAARAADWLRHLQAEDGSLGVRVADPEPCWPTSLAVLAWLAVRNATNTSTGYDDAIERAVQWILANQGVPSEQREACQHDTTLKAWPWVAGTHGWVEPTAFHVLALQAVGLGDHPRVREAIAMLLDRQLATGGWNYGNTVVLGNTLRPHVQPTGIALLALAREVERERLVQRSVEFLLEQAPLATTAMSLAWSSLGLASCERWRPDDRQLEATYQRVCLRDSSGYKLALLLHAAQGSESALIRIPSAGSREWRTKVSVS